MAGIFQLSNVQFFLDVLRDAISGVEWFVLLYIVCLLLFFIFGKRFLNEAFTYPFVFMLLTIYNPFLIVPLSEVIHLTDRIRRIFWLMPVNLISAYAFTLICTMNPRGRHISVPPRQANTQKRVHYMARTAAGIVLALFVVFLGSSVIPNYHMPENRYKVDNTVLSLSAYLEEDSSKAGLEKVILYSDTDLLSLREFDPSIESVLRRSDMLSFSPDLEDEESIQKIVDGKNRFKKLALVSRYHVKISRKAFKKAMRHYGVNYIIEKHDSEMAEYYTDAGYPLAVTVGNYDVFRKDES